MLHGFTRSAAMAAFLSVGVQAGAHHSNAPHYDATRPVELEGTVDEFEFVNPHAFLHIDVAGDEGDSVVWDCELTAAINLRRRGWTADMLVPGQRVTIRGIAARRDPHGCSIRSIVLEDGTELDPRRAADVNPGPPAEPDSSADDGLNGIAGIWLRDTQRRPNGPLTGPGPSDPGPPGAERFTEEGLAAQSTYDLRFDNPVFECRPGSVPRVWSGPGTPTEISLDADVITFRHEFMDTVRTARLGVREHAEELAPSELGHSIAWFEGRTLVIDTIGYTPGVLFPHPGVVHSEELHLVERLTVDPTGQILSVVFTAEDPKYFTSSFSGEFLYQPSPYAVEPYGCTVENSNR